MNKAADKRARTRLLAISPSLQHSLSQAHVDQWLSSTTPIDRHSLDILALSILQYIMSARRPLQRRQLLHDAELVEDIAAELFPAKIAYKRKRGGKAA